MRKHAVLMGVLLLLATWPFGAAVAVAQQPEPEREPERDGIRVRWSATGILQYRWIDSPEDDDDVAGFFDQFEYTPNKGTSAPIELGLREAALDIFRGEDDPVFQLRFESPGSNLGISGSDVDDPFFNQRLTALTRLDGLAVDLFYRRQRTEQLRLFPDTAGPGLLFDDLSRPDDRFQRDRTGFQGELRLRPGEAFDRPSEFERRLAPQLSLRGGHEDRNGQQQLRFLLNPTNRWVGLDKDWDSSVDDVGAGLLLAPDGLLTLALDFDYQRFRFDAERITGSQLGVPPPAGTRTIGFIPSSDRYTAGARLSSRLEERALIEAGFQFSQLEQVPTFTPDENGAGLRDNEVRTYSANASVDVELVADLSFNGFFKFDRRENNIDRNTALFNRANGSQLGPFVRDWQRLFVGGELELQLRGANRAAVGVRYDYVSRDLDYPDAGNPRILRANAHVRSDSRIVTVYGRTSLRPWRRLSLNAELGYRVAPDTGYIVELDDNVYGKLRGSYVFAWRRPLSVSAFVEGSRGTNNDFRVVSGQGPDPAGPSLKRSYESSTVTAGLTASISPIDRLSSYVSLFFAQNDQDAHLDLSSLQRYVQDQIAIRFEKDGTNNFQDQQVSLILGSHFQLSEQTDGRLSYTLTHAKSRYRGRSANPGCAISGSSCLDLIGSSRRIDSNTHGIDLELGHWLSPGFRILAGYRLQLYDDDARVVQSVASAVRPFDRSTHQHTATVGVTLTSEFFER